MSEGREGPASIVKLADAKKQRDRKRYADLVMQKFSDMEHAERREFLERRAEVERAGRERL